MAKCCRNWVVWNPLIGSEPNVDPPDESFDIYVYEIILDTTGFGASNFIYSITIDGVEYDWINYPGIGGQCGNPASWSGSMGLAATSAGIFGNDVAPYCGCYAGLDHSPTGYVYWGVAFDSPHTVSAKYDENIIGQPVKSVDLVERGLNFPQVLTGTQNNDPYATFMMYTNITAPFYTGGTASMGIPSAGGGGIDMSNDGDLLYYDFQTSLYMNGSFIWGNNVLVTPFDNLVAVVNNGASYDITLTNFFLPVDNIETTSGVVTLV